MPRIQYNAGAALSLIVYSCVSCSIAYLLAYDCEGQSRWPITKIDNEQKANALLNWVYARQNDFARCDNVMTLQSGSEIEATGIGAAINIGVRRLIFCFKSGCIYRPEMRWLWADDNQAACTLGQSYVDCFSKPLSFCLHTNSTTNEATSFGHLDLPEGQQHPYNWTSAMQLIPRMTDICEISKRLRKPLIWTMGWLTYYHIRLRDDIRKEVDLRVSKAIGLPMLFPVNKSSESSNIIMSVHVRAGSPDQGRKAVSMDHVMQAIDIKVSQARRSGYIVHRVYLCSDTQSENIVSEKYMASQFPRNFSYSVLDHKTLGSGEQEPLLIAAVANKDKSSRLERPKRHDLFVEYMSDIEIHVQADIFIGVHSNVYVLAASMRMARYPDRPLHHTCFLDIHRDPPPLICEGSDVAKHFWSKDFGSGGFQGGTEFFDS